MAGSTQKTGPASRFSALPTRIYCFADSVSLTEKLLSAGARIIQYRDKTVSDERFRKTAAAMLSMVRKVKDAFLIVNDRVDAAIEIGADGVHVGQEDEDCRNVAKRVPPEMILGVSARYPDLARAAERAGATYVGAGAVAATPSKPEAPVIGIAGLGQVVQSVRIPVVAIGGIDEQNLSAVLAVGARYAAVLSALNRAGDVPAMFRRLSGIAARFPVA